MGLLEELGINRRELITCPNYCGKQSKISIDEKAICWPTEVLGICLHIVLPIWQCNVCESEWLDGRGDHLVDNALEAFRHRKLTPTELKNVRKELGLTQIKLAKLTGWAPMSIKRWEGGKLEQSLVTDRIYRVLDHTLIKRLKAQTPLN